jgi:hypothetical protein
MSRDDLPRVRRAKVFHSKVLQAIDVSAIDWSRVPMSTIEEIEADQRRPIARLRRLVNAPRFAFEERRRRWRAQRQRVERGWSDGELWSLDTHLCEHLGSMLAVHAREARNHPPELDYDEWMGQLAAAAEAFNGYDPEDAERVAAARSALHWTADNLVDLWD